jgi:hypothetical protein
MLSCVVIGLVSVSLCFAHENHKGLAGHATFKIATSLRYAFRARGAFLPKNI